MTFSSQLYTRKQLRYQICELLKRLKTSPAGDGFGIPVELFGRDIRSLYRYCRSTRAPERIREIRDEFDFLHRERFGPSFDIRVLEIPSHPECLDDFETLLSEDLGNGNTTAVLAVRCTGENLRAFQSNLVAATRAAEGERGIYSIDSISGGGVQISSGDKIMKITVRGGNAIRSNLATLMLGGSVPSDESGHVSLRNYDSATNDYEIGHDVSLALLRKILLSAHGLTERSRKVTRKAITDAIGGLNKRAQKKLGRPLFARDGEGVRVATI